MVTWEGLNPPYTTIVADPPWQTKGRGNAFGSKTLTRVGRDLKDRRPEAQYSVLSFDGICALPVAEIAAPNAHLYLWATCSHLDQALAVLAAWDFAYKTTLTWIKRPGTLGLGAYFRTQTEHVLFGVRGSLPTLATDQRNYFEAAKTGHSRKPAAFADIVERSSPGPYVELFSREPRLGWDSWGYGYESERAS